MSFYVSLSMGVLLLLALSSAASGIEFTGEELKTDASTRQLYTRWCTKYPGGRGCNLANNSHRVEIFKSYAREIADINKGVVHSPRRLNEFSDITDAEFVESYASCYSASTEQQGEQDIIPGDDNVYDDDIPKSVDWRSRGAVTQVRDQGSCRSCWAFAAAGAVEALNQIQNGLLMTLSVQELVDCSQGLRCRGGNAAWALKYIREEDGVGLWEDNPYRGRNWRCQEAKKVVSIGGYRFVQPYNETALLQAVVSQPVIVAIYTGTWKRDYEAGRVFRAPCWGVARHQVLVVGFGEAQEPDGHGGNSTIKYWLIKNSWGVHKGEQGYYRLERGYESQGGLCGILTYPMYPIEAFELDD